VQLTAVPRPRQFDAPGDVTGERNLASQIAFGGADRRAQDVGAVLILVWRVGNSCRRMVVPAMKEAPNLFMAFGLLAGQR
jgi:hypothetical protein